MDPEPAPDPRRLDPFTVGGWLAEPKACRLSRGDTVVKLRPQLMDLLVCLARRAGEIVLKDEILAEVWASQYIAESGLSRCVAELRQSLGDEAHEPRFIETIPKRGYRLLAPVAWLPPAVRVAPAAAAGAPGAGAPETAPAPAVAGEAAPIAAPVAAPARRARLRPITRQSLALAGVVVAVAALTMTAVLSMGGWGGGPMVTERDTVLLADVVNTTGDRVFDDTLRLALGVSLGQAPFVRLLPREAVRGAMTRAGRPADGPVTGAAALDVCRREGAAVVLGTSIARIGSRYSVGLEAVACESGEEVWRTIEQAGDKDQVLDALERAATSARQILGETRESLRRHSVPLIQATTPSLDALKALSLGDDSRDHGRLDEALAFYRQATQLDPQFALAWARFGIGSANVGRPEDSLPAITRAYALADRVSPPERFYITAHYQRNVAGDIDGALETYRAWRRLYPGSLVPPTNIGNILTLVKGDYAAAVPEAEEAVRLAPLSSVAASILALAYRGAGRAQDSRELLDRLIARGVHDRIVGGLRIEAALGDGDAATIAREAQWAKGQPLAEIMLLQFRASDAVAHGRLAAARPLWAAVVERASSLGSGMRLAETELFAARALAVVGDRAAARATLDRALAADRSPWTLVQAAVVAAFLDDAARVRALLGQAEGRPVNDPAVVRMWGHVARALAAARTGEVDEALALLQPVTGVERGMMFRLIPLYVRGLAERAAGRPAEAAVTFARLTDLRAIEPTAPWVALAVLERARALREADDRAGSLAAYDAFLANWAGADADAPPLIAARREREALAAQAR
jgi:DNA-binding winged helix-turn-helix (wHTH) protein/tetratricopeptide (TPR) repeat protein